MSIPSELLDLVRKMHGQLDRVIARLRDIALKKNIATEGPDAVVKPKQDASDRQIPLRKSNPSVQNRDQFDKSWYQTMDGWKTLFELVAIPFAIGYALVTYCQWHDLRHNFQVDQRAWIQITPTIPIPPIDQNTVISKLPVMVKNVGKSAALHCSVETVVDIVSAQYSPDFRFTGKIHGAADVPLIFPGTSAEPVPAMMFMSDGSPRNLTRSEIQSLINGDTYLVLFTEARYDDPFGKHWTHSCTWKDYSRDPKSVFNADGCVRWNALGDGDPPP
jgi:hypothetical protein